MKTLAIAVAFLTSALCATNLASARSGPPVATVTAVPGSMSVHPGQWFPVAVVMDLETKWHIHTNAPIVPPELGSPEDYIKTTIETSRSSDGKLDPSVASTQWPAPAMVTVAFGGSPVQYGVFEGRAIAYVPVHVADDAATGNSELSLSVTYQACNDKVCVQPLTEKLTVAVAINPKAKSWPEDLTYPEVFAGFDASKLPAAASGGSSNSGSATNSGLSTTYIGAIVGGIAGAIVAVIVVKKMMR